MNSELLNAIRSANREFQEFIDQVAQDGEKAAASRKALRRLGRVDLRLKQISKHLAAESGSSAKDPDAAYEILKYRENLKTLQRTMESLQFSLLSEKGRLENVRANMQAAHAWATSLREIS